jgi:selenocysteine lyase/cysteine desulfurase
MFRERLKEIASVEMYHDELAICAIVTFLVKGRASILVKTQMQEKGFELSVVPATSTPLDSSRTSTPDLIRASISYTTTVEEIEYFCDELSKLVA